jgi:coenzyme F420-dependent glucose-6-phosphate dehydrogenase
VGVRFGYKASAEQFGPRELLDLSRLAEDAGFDTIAVSDHFQPWRHHGGHAPAVLPWLGALGQAAAGARLGTSVLTPTLRYNPAVIAQAFATLGELYPGRVFLGVGTGESMNEVPVSGERWPSARERRDRLAEAVGLIRELWASERVTFRGDYYQTVRATVYDRPDEPVPIYLAAGGPKAAELAGRLGDGFICTSGKAPELYATLLRGVEAGAVAAGRDPAGVARMIEVKVSYDETDEDARKACEWWAALALSAEEKSGVEDPVQLERLADQAADRAHTRFIVGSDPERTAAAISSYVELGFTELIFHGPHPDQARFIKLFTRDVLPLLQSRFG